MGQKNNSVSVGTLAGEIQTIFRSDPTHAESLIESHLLKRLEELSPGERNQVLEELTRKFTGDAVGSPTAPAVEGREISSFCSLLLGRNISSNDLTSAEVAERLAQSLNTVFDSLNKTIAVIHSSLLGRKGELETIRHIIGSDLEGTGDFQSLQDYLDQIREAFLVAHRGFQQAARAEVDKILTALDPAPIADAEVGLFRFGALRKAEQFEIYKEKYEAVRGWVESGRFGEDLLRGFENICGKEYTKHIKEMP